MLKKKIKIIIIVGSRPNFIKVPFLINELKRKKRVEMVLVHTGQHYDFEMSQVFFQELKIPKPHYSLGVGSGSHAWQTAKIMEKLEPVILREKPGLVIVVGDVNSTLAGALTAAKLNIPLAHIEAGLRSYNKTMPEEVNRVLTDHISDFLFCPTETAVKNLKKEGITRGVYNVGDIMYDTLIASRAKIQNSRLLERLGLKPKQYLLLTVHRAANADNLENLRKILMAVRESGEKIVFPVHPRTRKRLKKLKIRNSKLKIIPPVGYLDMLVLEKNAKKILTDSGGVQKEAYWMKVPCITLRRETEWVETARSGWNILTGVDEKNIKKAIKHFQPEKSQKNWYGSGQTAKKITSILVKMYG